jgi:hypothetical protein
MHRLQITVAALAMVVATTSASQAAAENVLRWASVGGAQTFDPHAYDDLQTWRRSLRSTIT